MERGLEDKGWVSFLHCIWQHDSDCSSSVCDMSTEIPRTHKLPISALSPSTVRVRGTQVSGLPPALEARKVNMGWGGCSFPSFPLPASCSRLHSGEDLFSLQLPAPS